jgi:hypothetical protein
MINIKRNYIFFVIDLWSYCTCRNHYWYPYRSPLSICLAVAMSFVNGSHCSLLWRIFLNKWDQTMHAYCLPTFFPHKKPTMLPDTQVEKFNSLSPQQNKNYLRQFKL